MARTKPKPKPRAKPRTPKPRATPKAVKPTGRKLDEAALLAAIADAPDDDAPRLVYADLVAEQGDDARAELITLQIARASSGVAMPTRHETSLVTRHAPRWLAPIIPAINKRSWSFHRGFLEAVTINPRRAGREVAGHPLWSTLRVAYLSDAGDPSPILIDPVMRNLRVVAFPRSLVGLSEVLHSDAPIETLRGLQLPGLRSDQELLTELIDCRGLPELSCVEFTGERADDPTMVWIGGLDRPGMRLVFFEYPDRFGPWWDVLVSRHPRHARIIVASASSQLERAGDRGIAVTVDPREVGTGLWDVALTLGLAGARPRFPPVPVARVVVRVPVGWQAQPVPLLDTPYATLPQLVAAIADRAQRELGTVVAIEEGAWTADHLADPREY